MKAKAIVKICICGTIALVLASVLVSLLAIPRVLDWKIGTCPSTGSTTTAATRAIPSARPPFRARCVSWMSAGSPAA